MMTRRQVLLSGLALLGAGRAEATTERRLSIGTTGVFLDDQLAFLEAWKRYIQARLDLPVAFVQRSSYREITELIVTDRIDFAWVCSPPYVSNRGRVRLLAIPIWRGKPLYQSYVIVPSEDLQTQSILDLGGKIYAYSDPDSNSGWLVPQVELKRAGKDPRTFFRKTFFTWAHRRIVEAVGSNLAQGGSIDGYVWETLHLRHPELTNRTRVAWKSAEFGFPPIIARGTIPENDFRAFRKQLVDMPNDAEGRELLRILNLDGFTPGRDDVFDTVAANMRFVGMG